MTRSASRLLTALALLLQLPFGLSPAPAMADLRPVAMCHANDGAAPGPAEKPTRHDCLACPICAAATTPAVLVPPPPPILRPGHVTAAAPPRGALAASLPSQPPAHRARGPPRVA